MFACGVHHAADMTHSWRDRPHGDDSAPQDKSHGIGHRHVPRRFSLFDSLGTNASAVRVMRPWTPRCMMVILNSCTIMKAIGE